MPRSLSSKLCLSLISSKLCLSLKTEYFLGNGMKVKIPSEIKPPLETYQFA
jgi:hypothetical protein